MIEPRNIRRSLSQHDQSRNSVAQSPRERQVGKARAYYQDCSIYPFVDGQIERAPFVRSELHGKAARLQQPRDLGSKRRSLRYNQYELSELSHPIFRPVLNARVTGAKSPKLLHFNYNTDNGPLTLASYCSQHGYQETRGGVRMFF
jgi:hypothetical protein